MLIRGWCVAVAGIVALGLALPAAAAPPRSIAGITAVLDQLKPDAARLAEARGRAEAAPLAGLPPHRLAKFLFEQAEAASGLGRAFFYAGTRAVLLTNWPVETNSARDLTNDLFRRQADDTALSRAAAIRQAMLALIDGPG